MLKRTLQKGGEYLVLHRNVHDLRSSQTSRSLAMACWVVVVTFNMCTLTPTASRHFDTQVFFLSEKSPFPLKEKLDLCCLWLFSHNLCGAKTWLDCSQDVTGELWVVRQFNRVVFFVESRDNY